MTVEGYREALRQWLGQNLDSSARTTFDDAARQQVAGNLYDAGLLAVTWPARYGGQGMGTEFQTAFNEETAAYSWAMSNSSVTVGICAPTILDFGTEAQKDRYLPRMLRGDQAWTQLLSEPGAGSDLASVSTRAEARGDEWVLNGQKVWTSSAVQSDYAIALVRTDIDVPKYNGVSMLIVDLRSEGVDIRPLREMTGEALFNEVFLDDVHVPLENVLGDVNDGWTVLTRMLFHERMALSAGTVGGRMDRDSFDDLAALARQRGVRDQPEVRQVLGELYMQQRLMEYMGVRMRAAADAGLAMGPVGSIGKIGIARSARLSAEAGLLIAGTAGQAWAADDEQVSLLAHSLLFFPMTGIAGGTTEIQKNVVAERVLGLPREERPDRDLPFRKTKVDGVKS